MEDSNLAIPDEITTLSNLNKQKSFALKTTLTTLVVCCLLFLSLQIQFDVVMPLLLISALAFFCSVNSYINTDLDIRNRWNALATASHSRAIPVSLDFMNQENKLIINSEMEKKVKTNLVRLLTQLKPEETLFLSEKQQDTLNNMMMSQDSHLVEAILNAHAHTANRNSKPYLQGLSKGKWSAANHASIRKEAQTLLADFDVFVQQNEERQFLLRSGNETSELLRSSEEQPTEPQILLRASSETQEHNQSIL